MIIDIDKKIKKIIFTGTIEDLKYFNFKKAHIFGDFYDRCLDSETMAVISPVKELFFVYLSDKKNTKLVNSFLESLEERGIIKYEKK